MRISDWSSDVCSSDLDDPDPPRFAGDRKGGARCNRRQAPQARRTSRAERTRVGVKEKIMTEAIKLLRIYTDEGVYLGDRRVFEVIVSWARDAGPAGVMVLEARMGFGQIGIAACEAIVCQLVVILVVARSFNQILVDNLHYYRSFIS